LEQGEMILRSEPTSATPLVICVGDALVDLVATVATLPQLRAAQQKGPSPLMGLCARRAA